MKYCINCGEAIPDIAKFCPKCAYNQNVSDQSVLVNVQADNSSTIKAYEVVKREKTPEEKAKIKAKANSIAKSSLLLLLSLMLVAMLFLPIMSVHVVVASENINCKIKVNMVDTAIFMVDSFGAEKDIRSTEGYEVFKNLVSSSLNDPERYEKFGEYVYWAFRGQLQTDDVAPNATLACSVIAAIAYAGFAITAFVFAILNFIGSFVSSFYKKSDGKLALNFAFLAPMMLPLIYFALKNGLWGVLNASSLNPDFTGWAFFTMILSVIVAVTIGVLNYAFKERKVVVLKIVKSSIIIVLALVAVCIPYAPMVTASGTVPVSILYTQSDDVSFKYDVSLFDYIANSEYNPDSIDIFNKDFKYKFHEFGEAYGKNDSLLDDGKPKKVSMSLIAMCYRSSRASDYSTMFHLVPILCFLSMAGILVILWQYLVLFASGEKSQKMIFAWKLVAILSVIIMFVLISICIFSVNDIMIKALNWTESYTFEMRFSVGLYLYIAYVIALFAIPSKERKNKKNPPSTPIPPTEQDKQNDT